MGLNLCFIYAGYYHRRIPQIRDLDLCDPMLKSDLRYLHVHCARRLNVNSLYRLPLLFTHHGPSSFLSGLITPSKLVRG